MGGIKTALALGLLCSVAQATGWWAGKHGVPVPVVLSSQWIVSVQDSANTLVWHSQIQGAGEALWLLPLSAASHPKDLVTTDGASLEALLRATALRWTRTLAPDPCAPASKVEVENAFQRPVGVLPAAFVEPIGILARAAAQQWLAASGSSVKLPMDPGLLFAAARVKGTQAGASLASLQWAADAGSPAVLLNPTQDIELFVLSARAQGKTLFLPYGIELPEALWERRDAFSAAVEKKARGEDRSAPLLLFDGEGPNPLASLAPAVAAAPNPFFQEGGNRRRGRVWRARLPTHAGVVAISWEKTQGARPVLPEYRVWVPWRGVPACPIAQGYQKAMQVRARQQTHQVALLTGWDYATLRRQWGGVSDEPEPYAGPEPGQEWYQNFFQ